MQGDEPLRHLVVRVLAVLALLAATARADIAQATVFRVDTTMDLVDANTSDGLCRTASDRCSLRAAIMQANRLPTSDQVFVLLPAGVYRLTITTPASGDDRYGDLNSSPSSNMILIGDGAGATIIDGNHTDGVLTVGNGASMTLIDLTVRNGYRDVSNLVIDGGGILTAGALTIVDCIIEDNYADRWGGGVAFAIGGAASVSIDRTIVRSNVARSAGGGMYLPNTTNSIRNSTISGNQAANGGGLYAGGPTILLDTTVSGNRADSGGGILGQAYLYSTTVADNDADSDGDGAGTGGGIFSFPGSPSQATNSLIARNTRHAGTIADDCDGTIAVYGYNLLGTLARCSFAGNGTPARGLVAPASFGPLADNGGRTSTHALFAGSAAIDATTAQGCITDTGAGLYIDQRGAPRSAGARCDVGAYEFGAPLDRLFVNGFE